MTRAPSKYPCTGRVSAAGFAEFAAQEIGEPRHNLRAFGDELKNLLGAPHLVFVNSGSSANLAAAILVKQRCGPRRRVLMSAFSFPTTIASFTLLGFDVRLVDTEADGFNLDPEALNAELDERVAAVVVTHFLGFPAQLGRIAALTRRHEAMLIQDACETMHLQVEGASLYSYGDLVTHSFYHPHHLSSFGGGAVVAGSSQLHDQIQSIVHWGRTCRCHYEPGRCEAPEGLNHNFWYEREGANLEMSELNACFGRWQLRTWPEQEAKRWRHWRIFKAAVAEIQDVQTWSPSGNISPFVFPIGTSHTQFTAVTREIMARGVELRSLMGGAMHRHPAYQPLAHNRLKHCEAMGGRSFFLGIHQTLETEQVSRAAAIVHEVLEAE